MAIADRKQRERLQRESLIMQEADLLLQQHGYLGLNLDELAERVEYSKATLYNHFASKEDLILAVGNTHLVLRVELFTRALTFQGQTRERMFGVGIADAILARLAPHGFPLLQFIRTPSLWEKGSPERQATFFQHSQSCVRVALEVIRQGRTTGDLPQDAPPEEQILSGLISLSKGAHLLADDPGPLFSNTAIDPLGALFTNYHLYLDGCGWRPLRAEWDYEASRKRIEQELFAEELQTITLP